MKLLTKLRDERASGTIEFAIVSTFLVLLFLGTVDFSRFLYYDTAIRNAARDGLETAMNPCSFQWGCDQGALPQADAVVMWSAYCEGKPSVNLQPAFSSCPPCSSNVSCSPPCLTSCTPCTQDVCVDPGGIRTQGESVTVTVGYRFQPVSFLLDGLFPAQSCFSGDNPAVNHHTLCATSVGRVAGGP
jgi:hypothetical protein